VKALVLSTNNYRSFPSRKQRFAQRLVDRGYDVLYVEAPVTWLAGAYPRQWPKLNAWRAGARAQGQHLWTASPSPWLPLFKKYEHIADHDAVTYYRYLSRLRGGWTSDLGVVVSYLPFVPETLRLLKAPVVYDCVDDHSSYPGLIDRNTVIRLEQRTATIADAVVATNETIAGRFTPWLDKLSIIPNGVDYNLFAGPGMSALKPGSGLSRNHRLLYVGAMREWFDTDVVAAVARALPEYGIDCFGVALPSVRQALADLPSVRFEGSLPQQEIAQLAPLYDAALIPFRMSPLTQGVDPLKFYEYTSAGLPVVSSPIDALGVFDESMVRIAFTPDEFVSAVQSSIDSDSVELRLHRIESSRHFDWSYRIAEFDRVIDAILSHRDA